MAADPQQRKQWWDENRRQLLHILSTIDPLKITMPEILYAHVFGIKGEDMEGKPVTVQATYIRTIFGIGICHPAASVEHPANLIWVSSLN